MEGDDQGDHALVHDFRPYQVQSDWCFGLVKKKYQRTKFGGLTDVVGIVNESATVNVAQPTGLEDGTVLVPTYDWQEYFKS